MINLQAKDLANLRCDLLDILGELKWLKPTETEREILLIAKWESIRRKIAKLENAA